MGNEIRIRDLISDEFKWDLTSIYQNQKSFYEDLEKVSKEIDEFTFLEKGMMSSGENLYNLLQAESNIDKKLNHLYMYAHLNKDSDTTNESYQRMYEKVYNLLVKFDEVCAFIIPTLLKYEYSKIEEFYIKYEKLLEWKFALELIYRQKNYILTEKEEKILSSFSSIFAFPEKVYDMFTNAELKFDKIKDEHGNMIQLNDSNFSVYIKSNDRRVRKSAFKVLYKEYSKYKNTISLMLSNDVKINNINSRIRGYNSSLEKALFADNVNIEIYNNLINTVESTLQPLHKYLKYRKQILNLDKLHLYDVYAPLISEVDKEYSFEDAKSLVIKSLEVLGKDYTDVIKKAFDERWIDIYPNVGKITGAYSSGSYTTNPYILLNFQGQLSDVSTLAHELGHSLHSYYSSKNNLYQYHQYKIFVAEVASTVNELLLSNYLLENSKDRKEKLFILNRLMELFRTTIYRQTMFAHFEKEIYEKEQNGEILTSEVICNIYYDINKKYFGKNVVVDKEIKYEWERVPHFYYNFYVYKYATGLAAACDIVTKILNKEENAVENYLEFLKTGGSDYPINELKIAGVDMCDEKVIKSAINMFDETLDKFILLYKQEYQNEEE